MENFKKPGHLIIARSLVRRNHHVTSRDHACAADYSLFLDGAHALAHVGAVVRPHVLVHFRVILAQIRLGGTARYGGESKRRLVRVRVHQLRKITLFLFCLVLLSIYISMKMKDCPSCFETGAQNCRKTYSSLFFLGITLVLNEFQNRPFQIFHCRKWFWFSVLSFIS